MSNVEQSKDEERTGSVPGSTPAQQADSLWSYFGPGATDLIHTAGDLIHWFSPPTAGVPGNLFLRHNYGGHPQMKKIPPPVIFQHEGKKMKTFKTIQS